MKSEIVCGLDEVGRGALAGPLILAGVILPENFTFEKIVIRDSKTMSFLQRQKAKEFIEKNALKIEIEVIDINKINDKGIGWGNKQGFLNLIDKIEAEKFVVDGNLKLDRKNVTSVVDADAKILSVMCASIIAKCYRDELMHNLHPDFPDYGWITNVGYGTKKHIEAIKKFGVTRHHRTEFVKTALKRFV